MIIVDNALQKRKAENNPIRVGMVGAGFMGKAIALQICGSVPGMHLAAICNRTLLKAKEAYELAGVSNVSEVRSTFDLQQHIKQGKYSITDNVEIICNAEGIDAIIEVTGTLEFGANVALSAIKAGKHLILVNAELDGTVGPILKAYADQAGVIITAADGDQPGVTMNLYRFVRSLGVRPVLCGNIKGLHDPYRNPTTQESYAKAWGIDTCMVTAAADGSKISFEQAIVANGTGMLVGKRGMHGPSVPAGTPIQSVMNMYPLDELMTGAGIVDYVVGAMPAPGVFVLGTISNPLNKHYLNYYKLGEGPLYCFYTPYHLCHLEVPNSVARAVLFRDATLAPIGHCVDVVAAAKTPLKAGQIIDGIGKYMVYGLCENANICHKEKLLPLGVAEGCVLKNEIEKDHVITYDDVLLPKERLVDNLRVEQSILFHSTY